MSHAIHAVVERAALTVDARLEVFGERPLDNVDGFVGVGDVVEQRPLGLGRHRLVIYGDLVGAKQFVNLEHLDDHFPAFPFVVQRRVTQRMRVALQPASG